MSLKHLCSSCGSCAGAQYASPVGGDSAPSMSTNVSVMIDFSHPIYFYQNSAGFEGIGRRQVPLNVHYKILGLACDGVDYAYCAYERVVENNQLRYGVVKAEDHTAIWYNDNLTNAPAGICVKPDGSALYVLDGASVRVINPATGALVSTTALDDIDGDIKSMTIDSSGNYYTNNKNTVYRHSSAGTLLYQWDLPSNYTIVSCASDEAGVPYIIFYKESELANTSGFARLNTDSSFNWCIEGELDLITMYPSIVVANGFVWVTHTTPTVNTGIKNTCVVAATGVDVSTGGESYSSMMCYDYYHNVVPPDGNTSLISIGWPIGRLSGAVGWRAQELNSPTINGLFGELVHICTIVDDTTGDSYALYDNEFVASSYRDDRDDWMDKSFVVKKDAFGKIIWFYYLPYREDPTTPYADRSRQLAYDSDYDYLYVLTEHDWLIKINCATGLQVWVHDHEGKYASLTIAPNGNIIVAKFGAIECLSPGGGVSWDFYDPIYSEMRDIGVTNSNNIIAGMEYTVDNPYNLVVISSSGSVVSTHLVHYSSYIPIAFAVDSTGLIYAIFAYYDVNVYALVVMDASYNKLTHKVIDPVSSYLYYSHYMFVDSDDNIWMSHYDNDRVKKFKYNTITGSIDTLLTETYESNYYCRAIHVSDFTFPNFEESDPV